MAECAGGRLRLPSAVRLAVLAVPLLVLFHGQLTGGVFFQRDVQLLWLSHVEALVHAVASGAWPAWNRALAFGQPLWADANAQAGYPPTWLNLVVPPWRYYTLYVIAHFVLGAAGVHRLARRLELSAEAALAAAVVWMAAGPNVSMAPMWNQLAGAAWLPWCLLGAEVALQSGRAVHALAWGAALAAPILAGSPEASMMAALLGAALALAEARRRPVSRLLGALALAAAFALALSAVQWMPSLEAVRHSARVGMTAAARAYWSVPPAALLQTVLPVLVDAAGLRSDRAAALAGSREPFFASLYLGLGAAGLVAAAWAAPSPRRRRVFFTLALAAGALMALGRHTPLYGWAEALVPPLRALRYPAKAMMLAACAWSLLAGMGVDAWRSCESWPRRARLCLVIAVSALTLAAGSMTVLLFHDPARWGAEAFAMPAAGVSYAELVAPTRWRLAAAAIAGAAVLLAAAFGARRGASGHAAAVVVMCAAADLLFAHRSLNPAAPPELYTHRPELLDVLREFISRERGGLGGPESPPSSNSEREFISRERDATGQRLYVYDYFFPGRSRRYLGREAPYVVARAPGGWPIRAAQALAMRLYLFPPTAGTLGVPGSFDLDVPGLGSPHVAALGELLRAAEGTPAHLRLLQVGAVGHVVALHDEGFVGLERVALVDSLFREPIRVFRVPEPRPRTYAVGGARVADGPAALSLLADAAFDPALEIMLDSGPAVPAPPGFSGTSRVTEMAADRVRLEAELSAPGYVVLVDAWDPAWHASLDGRPVPALRANVAFLAVAAPAGRHAIELRYRPSALPWGLGITAAAIAAGMFWFAGVRR